MKVSGGGECDGLDDPPNIDDIVDRFCCVIGDVFHAMDRAKVPIRHEAKKVTLLLCVKLF